MNKPGPVCETPGYKEGSHVAVYPSSDLGQAVRKVKQKEEQ